MNQFEKKQTKGQKQVKSTRNQKVVRKNSVLTPKSQRSVFRQDKVIAISEFDLNPSPKLKSNIFMFEDLNN